MFWYLKVTPRQSPSQANHHPPRQPSTSSSGLLEWTPGRSKKAASVANLIDSDISGDEGGEDPTTERDLINGSHGGMERWRLETLVNSKLTYCVNLCEICMQFVELH